MADASGPDSKILSYGDVLLRRSDLTLLEGPHWLNDRIIDFYFEFLNKQYSAGEDKDGVMLVGSSISFWFMHCQDDSALKDMVASLHLNKYELLFFPVNNSTDLESAQSGSHWSLLLFVRQGPSFYHIDSSGGANSYCAQQLARSLQPLLLASAPNETVWVEDLQCIIQTNGYDCGVYVLTFAELLCSRWKDMKAFTDLKHGITDVVLNVFTSSLASERREIVRKLIADMAKQSH